MQTTNKEPKLKAKSFKANLRHAARQHARQELRLLTQEAMEEIENPNIIKSDAQIPLDRLIEERDNLQYFHDKQEQEENAAMQAELDRQAEEAFYAKMDRYSPFCDFPEYHESFF